MEHNSTYFEGWDVWNVSLVTASDEYRELTKLGILVMQVTLPNFNDEWFGLWVLRLFERRMQCCKLNAARDAGKQTAAIDRQDSFCSCVPLF